MVKTAAGVVSEARFSGFARLPNRYQGYWTHFNMAADNGDDLSALEVRPIADIPDFYIYEMVKNSNLPLKDLAKNLHTTPKELQTILTRHMEVEARLNMIRDEAYNEIMAQMYEQV